MTGVRQIRATSLMPAGIPSTQPDSSWFDVDPRLGIAAIDHLYNRLDGAYPGRWRRDFPDRDAIRNWRESWAEAFENAGLTLQEVLNAVHAVTRRYTWPPSISEFLAVVHPPVDPELAYHEAVTGLQARLSGHMGEWTHRAIFWAAHAMERDLLKLGQAQIKARWDAALAKQLEKGRWAEIPEPVLRMPAPGATETERLAARRNLASLRATAIFKTVGGERDTSWARHVMARAQYGDSSLTRAIIESAEIVLRRGSSEVMDGPPTNEIFKN